MVNICYVHFIVSVKHLSRLEYRRKIRPAKHTKNATIQGVMFRRARGGA